VVNRPFHKFKYFGPFEMLERIGQIAYKIKFPEGSLIRNVFHVSQIKPFTPNHTLVYSDLKILVDLSVHELQSEAVMERRLVKKR
jgi:hypothetical protein